MTGRAVVAGRRLLGLPVGRRKMPDSGRRRLLRAAILTVAASLTLGALFMIIVIFLPGGLMEGFARLSRWVRSRMGGGGGDDRPSAEIIPVQAQ